MGQSHVTTNERPIELADRFGSEIVRAKSAADRKASGLYLTPARVADFMASQVSTNRRRVRLLDPAAGSGTLLCAVVEYLACANDTLQEVDVVAYETDSGLHHALSEVLEDLQRWAAARDIELSAKALKEDFLLAHPETLKSSGQLFNNEASHPFNVVIGNPPYFKIPKSDRRAQEASAIVYGQPNIYALFMAASSALLDEGGEFIFITPRSFASGPYFRAFRERFFADLRPTKVHLFGSRREAFGRDEVLQENLILNGVRDLGWAVRPENYSLELSSSSGVSDLDRPFRRLLTVRDVLDVNTAGGVLRLPILESEDAAMKSVDSWKGSLHRYGMNISTGPVVPFRATQYLIDAKTPSPNQVPLIWMNHVHAMRISFPNGTRKPQFIQSRALERSLLLPNRNYVLLRRFSAKEEAHRLVAAPWLRTLSASSWLGIENHLNYIYRQGGELSEEECLGLAAILNSELLDIYFRVSSGNTQVSATELRAMPLPPLEKIKSAGRILIREPEQANHIDELLQETLGTSR